MPEFIRDWVDEHLPSICFVGGWVCLWLADFGPSGLPSALLLMGAAFLSARARRLAARPKARRRQADAKPSKPAKPGTANDRRPVSTQTGARSGYRAPVRGSSKLPSH